MHSRHCGPTWRLGLLRARMIASRTLHKSLPPPAHHQKYPEYSQLCPPIEALLGAPGPGCVARPAVLDSNRSPYKGQPKNRPLWMARCLAMSRTADEGGTHTWWETSQLLRGQRGGEPAAATCHFEQNLARIKHILAGSGGQKSFVSGRQRFHENRAIKHNVTASPFFEHKRAASRSSGV